MLRILYLLCHGVKACTRLRAPLCLVVNKVGKTLLQPFPEQMRDARLTINQCVQWCLGDTGRILLGMSPATVADQINHDIHTKLLTIGKRQLRHLHHGDWIIGIDMQYRCIHDPRNISAQRMACRAQRVWRSETDLVVNDHMECSIDCIAAMLGQFKRLHDHALAAECRITMQHHRGRRRSGDALCILGCACHAQQHRVDTFQMRRVMRQLEFDHPVYCLSGTGSAQMEGQVVMFLRLVGSIVKVRQDPVRCDLHEIDQQIQASPMRHGKKEFADPLGITGIQQGIHQQ